VGEKVNILLIEDDPRDIALFDQLMSASRYRSFPELCYSIKAVKSMGEAVGAIEGGNIGIVVVDLLLPGTSPNEVLAHIEKTSRKVPIVALTTEGAIDIAVDAIKHGAQDYLVKGSSSGDAIDRSIRYAIERKKLSEEQARIRDELRRSNEELQQFASVTSHDLKEPLRMVTMYLSLLEKRSSETLDDKSREYLVIARDGAERMAAMIDDLLAYSRVESGEPKKTPVHMDEALSTALTDLRAAIEENGALVTHDKLPTVTGDRSQIIMLLENLIGNAIKYRSEAAPQVYVSVRMGDGEWIISVRDNGIGIAPEYADKLFKMFSRLHTRDEYPGTGIGLAVSRKIVERHHGRIWFESEPGKGTTFFFTMPVMRDDERAC